jgi:hypothetical protein
MEMSQVKGMENVKLLGQPNEHHHFGGTLQLKSSDEERKQDAITEFVRIAKSLKEKGLMTSDELKTHVAAMEPEWLPEAQKAARQSKT